MIVATPGHLLYYSGIVFKGSLTYRVSIECHTPLYMKNKNYISYLDLRGLD